MLSRLGFPDEIDLEIADPGTHLRRPTLQQHPGEKFEGRAAALPQPLHVAAMASHLAKHAILFEALVDIRNQEQGPARPGQGQMEPVGRGIDPTAGHHRHAPGHHGTEDDDVPFAALKLFRRHHEQPGGNTHGLQVFAHAVALRSKGRDQADAEIPRPLLHEIPDQFRRPGRLRLVDPTSSAATGAGRALHRDRAHAENAVKPVPVRRFARQPQLPPIGAAIGKGNDLGMTAIHLIQHDRGLPPFP